MPEWGDLTAWRQSRAVARHVEWSKDAQVPGTRNEERDVRYDDANCEMRGDRDSRQERKTKTRGTDARDAEYAAGARREERRRRR